MSNRWSTPDSVFCPLDVEFGFTLDVCAEPWNAKCPVFFSPDQDGLQRPWTGTCWMNPPYGREIGDWIRKAYSEWQRGATVVALIPSRTETSWWHDYCMRGEIRFIRGRIHFTDPNGRSGRPRFGNAVVVFRAQTANTGADHMKKRYDELIHVRGDNMVCCEFPDSPLIQIAQEVKNHYDCPWRAAEDITLRITHMMLAAGFTIKHPNRPPRTAERCFESEHLCHPHPPKPKGRNA